MPGAVATRPPLSNEARPTPPKAPPAPEHPGPRRGEEPAEQSSVLLRWGWKTRFFRTERSSGAGSELAAGFLRFVENRSHLVHPVTKRVMQDERSAFGGGQFFQSQHQSDGDRVLDLQSFNRPGFLDQRLRQPLPRHRFSRRTRADLARSMASRVHTEVSQARGSRIVPVSARCHRSQVSCTMSCALASSPVMR